MQHCKTIFTYLIQTTLETSS